MYRLQKLNVYLVNVARQNSSIFKLIDLNMCTIMYNYIYHKEYFYSGDMTGIYSIYTMYEGHEIMFHVSTLLPFSKDNRQQVISALNYN